LANLIKGYSSLHEEYDKVKHKVTLWAVLMVVSFFAMLEWGIFFIGIVVCGFFLGKYSKLLKLKRSAIDGERTMNKVCRKLPESYTVVTNVELTSEGKTHYLDQIIVGPSGVYLIETKNMNGSVVGHADSGELLQHKIGRQGGRYSNRVRNPIKQLGGQLHHLSNYFKYHGVNVWVKGVVYFTNSEVKVNIASAQVPIFTQSARGAKQLKKHLLDAEANGQVLSQQDQQKIVAILTGQTP